MPSESGEVQKWKSVVRAAKRYEEWGFVTSEKIKTTVRNVKRLRRKVIPHICGYERTKQELEACGIEPTLALMTNCHAKQALCRFSWWSSSISNLLAYEQAVASLYEYPPFPPELRNASREEQVAWVFENRVDKVQSARNRASLIAKLLHNPNTANSPEVHEFIAIAKNLPPAVWKYFLKQACAPKLIRPRDTTLDCWLISIWPIVIGQKWTWDQVLLVAMEKFPQIGEKGRIQGADAMRLHVTWLNRRLTPLQQLRTDAVRTVGKQVVIVKPKLAKFALSLPPVPLCLTAIGFRVQ